MLPNNLSGVLLRVVVGRGLRKYDERFFSVHPNSGWDNPRYVPPIILTGAGTGSWLYVI